MSESKKSVERCSTCPERNCVSRIAAKLGKTAMPADCLGSLTVHRGRAVTQTRPAGAPAPPQKTWNIVIATSAEEEGDWHYSRTDWQAETVCGRQSLELRDDETQYVPVRNGPIWKDPQGRRHTIIVDGSDAERKVGVLGLGMADLL